MILLNSREEYFQYPAVNSSMLKAMDQDPETLAKPNEDISSKDGVSFGDAVDTLMFDGIEVFNSRFYGSVIENKLNESLQKLADEYLIEIKKEGESILNIEYVLELSKQMKLWGNVKDNKKRESRITSDFWSYIHDKMKSVDKIVFPKETYDNVFKTVKAVKESPFTSMYFENQEGIENLYQLAFTFTYDEFGVDIDAKAMLDLVHINHNEQYVIPIDMKTTALSSKPKSIPSTILKYRYDIQAELYMYGIKKYVNENYPGYSVKPFRWIFCNSASPKPYLYYIQNINVWRNRVNATSIGTYKSLYDLMNQYVWHYQNQKFEYEPEMYENGIIELK